MQDKHSCFQGKFIIFKSTSKNPEYGSRCWSRANLPLLIFDRVKRNLLILGIVCVEELRICKRIRNFMSVRNTRRAI